MLCADWETKRLASSSLKKPFNSSFCHMKILCARNAPFQRAMVMMENEP